MESIFGSAATRDQGFRHDQHIASSFLIAFFSADQPLIVMWPGAVKVLQTRSSFAL